MDSAFLPLFRVYDIRRNRVYNKTLSFTAASVVSSKNDYAVLCTQMAATPLFMASRALSAIRRSLCGPHRMINTP